MSFKIGIILFLLVFMAALYAFMSGEDKRTENSLTVFAASSFAYVLHEEKQTIEAATGLELTIVEAASSTLARQIEEGAPADVFITADRVWLDYLSEAGHFEGKPVEVARNRLVWVFTISEKQLDKMKNTLEKIRKENNKEGTLVIQSDGEEESLFITGDPEFVPLGRFAKESLINMGHWEKYKETLVPAENARKAVWLMENQAPAYGILYLTDALSSEKINIFEEIPEETHTPILYFAASLKQSNRVATENFINFLKSETFRTILKARGFEVE